MHCASFGIVEKIHGNPTTRTFFDCVSKQRGRLPCFITMWSDIACVLYCSEHWCKLCYLPSLHNLSCSLALAHICQTTLWDLLLRLHAYVMWSSGIFSFHCHVPHDRAPVMNSSKNDSDSLFRKACFLRLDRLKPMFPFKGLFSICSLTTNDNKWSKKNKERNILLLNTTRAGFYARAP